MATGRAAAAAARCVLATRALAAALGGCTATSGTAAHQPGTADSQQGDSSGVTVFGTVDLSVGRQRSR
ncbi:hypothetical protein [Pulveribacter suum]|uniref:Uncharacterized protein n=1 Tax=Pulveribacter suum TaxID=2116657 RepID=A0A2P1NHA1_9BURK|nr:hypothetical protein [Pulveribacter suum]AVP56426.1 hypothetical protein C7H73_01230 [Pulveribacter suum]